MLKTLIVTCILYSTSASSRNRGEFGPSIAEYDVRGSLMDHSPYCKELAQITDLCNQVFVNVYCPKTCDEQSDENEDNQKSCGKSFLPIKKFPEEDIRKRVRRIVGGKESTKGAYPWQVGLFKDGSLRCGGAILTPNWIVTTASCFDENNSFDARDWLVTSGEYNLDDNDEKTEQVRSLKKILIHDDYHRYDTTDTPYRRDIALLKLEKPLVIGKDSRNICLPGLQDNFESKSLCKVTGWGSISKSNKLKLLKEATVKVVPRDICNLPASYDGKIHESAMCAGYKESNTDSCTSDSGGPLACRKGTNWYVVGLVSWGFQCGKPKRFGVYTNVRYLNNWIIQTMLTYDEETNSLINKRGKVPPIAPKIWPQGNVDKRDN